MFNVAGDINRLVYHVYGPDFGARNDKTAARFDPFMQDLYRRKKYADVQTTYSHHGSLALPLSARALSLSLSLSAHPERAFCPPQTNPSHWYLVSYLTDAGSTLPAVGHVRSLVCTRSWTAATMHGTA
jgi:hypothetical protein